MAKGKEKKKPTINDTFFSDRDAPHSKAKRQMLWGFTEAFFAAQLNRIIKFSNKNNTIEYIDGFCGKGTYVREKVTQSLEDDIAKWGSPIIALHAFNVLLQRLAKIHLKYRGKNQYYPDGLENKHFYLCHFNFVDINPSNIRSLDELVNERLELWGWTINHCDNPKKKYFRDNFSVTSTYSKQMEAFNNAKLMIKVTLVVKDFKEYMKKHGDRLHKDRNPLFAFVDPFGFHADMDSIAPFLRPSAFLFYNLMVETVNRLKDTDNKNISKVYGGDNWVEAFIEEDESSEAKFRKFDYLVGIYKDNLRKKEKNVVACHFAFRKGKKDPENAPLYYMISVCNNYTVMQQMKLYMQKLSQTKDGQASFSDFYFHMGVDIPMHRKTSNDFEAKIIFDKFKGEKSVKLGIIKKFVLEETPFPYHAQAMRYLENKNVLNFDPGTLKLRGKNKSFDAKISLRCTSKLNMDLCKISFEDEWPTNSASTSRLSASTADLATKPQNSCSKRRKKDKNH